MASELLLASCWLGACLASMVVCWMPRILTSMVEESRDSWYVLFNILRCIKRKRKTATTHSQEHKCYDSDDTLASTAPGDSSNDDLSDSSSPTDEVGQLSGYQGNHATKTARKRPIDWAPRRPLPCSDAPPALRYSAPATTPDRVRAINKPVRQALPRLNAPPGLDAPPGLAREWTAEEQVSHVLHALELPAETCVSAWNRREARLRKDSPCFSPSPTGLDAAPGFVIEWTAKEQLSHVLRALEVPSEKSVSGWDRQETCLRQDAPCSLPSTETACHSDSALEPDSRLMPKGLGIFTNSSSGSTGRRKGDACSYS